MTKKKRTHVDAAELIQLNQAQADIELAKVKLAHTLTNGHLSRALHDCQRLQVEVNQLKAERASVLAAQQQLAAEKEALTHKVAMESVHKALASEIRDRYAVPVGHGIDPISGEIVAPES